MAGLSSSDQGMTFYADLTPVTACRVLAAAGYIYPSEAVRVDARDKRWAVSLTDGHMAWFPASAEGARRLAVERRVLDLSQVAGSTFVHWFPAGAILGVSTAAAKPMQAWSSKSAVLSVQSSRNSIR